MTKDAHTEAERIVFDFEEAVAKHEATAYDSPLNRPAEDYWGEERKAGYDRLVAALAAAIDVESADRMAKDSDSNFQPAIAWRDDAIESLREALSALRGEYVTNEHADLTVAAHGAEEVRALLRALGHGYCVPRKTHLHLDDHYRLMGQERVRAERAESQRDGWRSLAHELMDDPNERGCPPVPDGWIHRPHESASDNTYCERCGEPWPCPNERARAALEDGET